MNLDDLVNRSVPFTFEYPDCEPLNGEFYKYKISPAYLQELKKLQAEQPDSDEIDYKVLADLIKSWDMTAKGEVLELTPENFKIIPIVYLAAFYTHLIEISTGNPSPGPNSPNGSLHRSDSLTM